MSNQLAFSGKPAIPNIPHHQDTISFSKEEIRDLIITISTEVAKSIIATKDKDTTLVTVHPTHTTEQYYRFPEDIYIMLDGKVAEKTIKNWGSLGYLKVTKFGQKAFISHDNWKWFKENHAPLMAKDSRRR